MNRIGFLSSVVVSALMLSHGAGATVAPIVAGYGDVFPTLTEQSLSVYRSADASPWFITFNLLAQANVKLGADELPGESNGGANGIRGNFDVTAIRIVDINGGNVAFGTDTFSNPFPSHIVALVDAPALPAGLYALAVSGSGDRILCTPFCGDAPDFVVRLQITPVPEPGHAALLLSGLVGLSFAVLRMKMKR